MNRTLKFRAWDTSEEQMIEDLTTWTDDFTDELNTTFDYYKDKGLIVMQFTGLYDKNGKEIWEGDVVKLNGITEYGKRIQSTHTVEFKEGSFVVHNGYEYIRLSEFVFVRERYKEDRNDCEVIGNIYSL